MQVLIGTPAEVVEVLNGLEKIEEKQKSGLNNSRYKVNSGDIFTGLILEGSINVDGNKLVPAVSTTYL